MSEFIAHIRAELDTSRAEAQLKTLQNNHAINLDVNLTGDGASLVKSFDKQIAKLNTSADNAGKQVSKNLATGMKSVKFDRDTYLSDYIKQQKKDVKESESVATKHNTSQKAALKAVRATNASEIKINTDHAKSIVAIENVRIKSIENAKKREEKITSQQNNAINKQQQSQFAAQQKQLEQQKNQLSKYSKDFELGNYSADSKVMSTRLKGYEKQNTESINKAKSYLDEYNSVYSDIQKHFDKSSTVKFSNDELNSKFESLEASAKKYSNAMREVTAESSKSISSQTAFTKSNEIMNYYNQNTKAVKKYGDELQNLSEKAKAATTQKDINDINTDFKALKSTISEQGLTGRSFGAELKRGFTQIGQFVGVYGMLQQGVDTIKQMASATLEVDTAMSNLQMATGVSVDQAKVLMSTYQQMGKELKATGIDVATSATEWLKQGQSQETSQLLAKDSIILSKIGDLSSGDSTKYLTSAMKGYQINAENTLNIVDKLSAVDLASATDVGGLAEGMSEVANNANLAGVSMDKLLGYLATVGEVTQEGMSTVGHSFSTIFSRMGNIKLARLNDYQNNGEDLSNVETVLRGEGIELRDSTDTFRNFGEVIDEVASKWDSYSEVSQRAIASAFAGKNQMEEFLVLMQNYDKATEYKNLSENSSGQALEKFEAYQNSLQGKVEGLKGAFQSLSTVTIESDFLKNMTDGGTALLNVLTQVVDKVGILPAILAGVGTTAFIKNLD